MNTKRFWITSVAVFVFTLIYETVVHGFLLKETYAITPQLWRADADMNMVLMMLTYAATSLLLVYLFSQKMNVQNMKQGMHAGIWVGLPIAILGAASYIWMPISVGLGLSWFFASFIKIVSIGKMTGMLYKD